MCESLQMLPTVSQFLCFKRSLTCFLSLSDLHQDNCTFENEVSIRAVSLRGSSAKQKKKLGFGAGCYQMHTDFEDIPCSG